MTILSSRGYFVAMAGIFLISLGLALAGVATVTTMVPMLFRGGDIFGAMLGGETGNQTVPTGDYPDGMEFLAFFDIDQSIVDYAFFSGCLMLIATIIGLPSHRITANPSLIRITRNVDREKAFAGEFVHVTVSVENTGSKRLDFIEIYDAIPETFELTIGENFIITQMAGKETKIFSYIIRVPTRGVYKIGPTKVIIHDRLGFYFEEDVREFFTEVLVYPSYEDIRRADALSKKRQIGKMFGSHKTREKGSGDDFHSLRLFYPGDEFKKIDWKAFSRTGELMVREFEAEKNIRMVIFLDHSGSMGGGIPNNTKLDFAIRGTMLAHHLAVEKKDIVGIVTFSEQVTSYLAPSGKKNLFFQMLETLALVEPRGASNPLAAIDYVLLRLPRASFFLFISDLEASDAGLFVEAVKRARASKNHVTVISPLGPLFETTSELSPVERALSEAIMEEFMIQRRMVEDALKGLNVDIIDCGPDDILAHVINQYNKAKNQGKGLM